MLRAAFGKLKGTPVPSGAALHLSMADQNSAVYTLEDSRSAIERCKAALDGTGVPFSFPKAAQHLEGYYSNQQQAFRISFTVFMLLVAYWTE